MKPSSVTPLLFALSLSASAWAGTVNHKAHVHGNAKLTVALESDTKANIDLDVPADSIFGFEHKARTPSDKAAQDAGLNKLGRGVSEVIRFDPDLGCAFKVTKLGLEAEEKVEEHEKTPSPEQHGEHADVNFSYEVQCKKSMKGSSIQVGLMVLFTKIKKVSLQILTESGQAEKEVADGKRSYRLD